MRKVSLLILLLFVVSGLYSKTLATRESNIYFDTRGYADYFVSFGFGKSNSQRTGSVSFGSNGHVRFCSLAAFSTLLTVVFDALQLRAMLVWLRPNPANRMISRYLVINDDLLHNVFTH